MFSNFLISSLLKTSMLATYTTALSLSIKASYYT
jgi:hypothetical protein